MPGEDLPGSFSATDFVAWYSGHPDAELDRFTLRARRVVVIGVGNVAVDVARVLAKTAAELSPTDVPDHVLDVLDASAVEEITMVGRRGPAQARFTTKELRELGELANADVLVDPADLELSEAASRPRSDRTGRCGPTSRCCAAGPARSPAGPAAAAAPALLAAAGRDPRRWSAVERARATERTRLAGGRLVGTGETVDLPAEMVLRSVGYRGVPLPGLPFDEATGMRAERGRPGAAPRAARCPGCTSPAGSSAAPPA